MHLPLDEAEEQEWSAPVCGTDGVTASTAAFLKEVEALPNLVAVLTGAAAARDRKKGQIDR
eukprot:SAG22_NODE_1783_length_3591_cov_1.767182_2_plen_61_part_00